MEVIVASMVPGQNMKNLKKWKAWTNENGKQMKMAN
jgi:hypothetical protein